MAEAKLNFDEEKLDKDSALYGLYDRLYQGMAEANQVDAPSFPSFEDLLVKDDDGHIKFDENGNPLIDQDKKAQVDIISSQYSEIMMKNSAYLFANAIVTVIGTGGGTGTPSTSGCVSRAGDSMSGTLNALYGFDAGVGGQKIFEVTIDADDHKWAVVNGGLKVSEDAEITGLVKLGQGIAFDGNTAIYLDNGTLIIERQNITLKGDVTVDGTFSVGDVTMNSNGIFWDDNEFYHAGNSNKSDVDWTMLNAKVYGDLNVDGDASIDGQLKALKGFALGDIGLQLLYSENLSNTDKDGNTSESAQVVLDSDLRIINSHGIKFENDYIINVRNNNVVSFSAPGMIMNLGDSDNGKVTNKISLQSDIWDYSNNYKIISKEGAGNFPNGLQAKCAVSGSSVLATFSTDEKNMGVLFNKQIRFGEEDGPAIYKDPATGGLNFLIPYIHVEDDGAYVEQLSFSTYYAQTTSPFRNLSLDFSSEAEFFAFDKPVESEFFAIKSETYCTRLIENVLFFDDGKFIEGVVDGLRFAGNGYFDGNISSPNFASGFAGYGWAVKSDITLGGFHATFDSLTIRKKMRVYELEVQKNSCTNGSLWVSDSCSGDEVIVLN